MKTKSKRESFSQI